MILNSYKSGLSKLWRTLVLLVNLILSKVKVHHWMKKRLLTHKLQHNCWILIQQIRTSISICQIIYFWTRYQKLLSVQLSKTTGRRWFWTKSDQNSLTCSALNTQTSAPASKSLDWTVLTKWRLYRTVGIPTVIATTKTTVKETKNHA